ncbi:MAG: peptide chain release factor N(5)-glutamine methyltransferase [Stellaceae bacterium]
MPATVGSVLAEAAAVLSQSGLVEPRRRARQVIGGSLGLEPAELLLYTDRVLDEPQVEQLHSHIERLAAGEPLSRILSRREFWGLDFDLVAETLDPRPESETVVEAVLARVDRKSSLRLLDLGTGSGCLLLALLSELRIAFGVGVDLSPRAAAAARRNAQLLGLSERTSFFVGDWGSALLGRFDVIVANPPYIATAALAELPPEVGAYDPTLALDGGEDGLCAYRGIVTRISDLMAASALVALETGTGQASAVAAILSSHGLAIEAIEQDLAGHLRCLVARRPPG